ncbi:MULTISPECIES: OsmC family protein [unclassified Sedimentibacter]|uniref:OsmC family protein n=1 Tax=unclassified Sedimentibacter TaxID=2649220 RepID=UPI0027E1ED35|nr:OsmC family protein [Sedimentibacter sp. MB35-C1]WMJ76686.1 OsmC family protein [Sedimentibacter sp. MB35-C1]
MEKTKINANLKGNMAFEMKINGHTVITDTVFENGGNNLGPSPKALLLAGLIGCSGIDIMTIVKKMRLDVKDVHVEIEAESRDEDPKIYNYIKIIYKFIGTNLEYKKLERAVKLSLEKYCGVAAMLEKAVPISYEIQIIE